MTALARPPAGGWKAGIVLLLCFMTPTLPLFAQIQEDRAGSPPSAPSLHGRGAMQGRPIQDRLLAGLLAAGIAQLELEQKSTPEISSLKVVLTGERPFTSLLAAAMTPDLCEQGRQAGFQETSAPLWFVLGMTLWGLLFAYVSSASPDEDRLPQMSANDLALYKMCYQDGVKSARVKWAWIGVAAILILGAAFAYLIGPSAAGHL